MQTDTGKFLFRLYTEMSVNAAKKYRQFVSPVDTYQTHWDMPNIKLNGS